MISADSRKVQFTLTSGTQTLAVPFYFLDNSHIRVVRARTGEPDEVLGIGAGYTISGAGVELGGAIVLDGTMTDVGDRVTIRRNIPLTQLVEYVANDRFPASTHERALDQLTMIAQFIAEIAERSLVFGESELITDGNILPAGEDRASKVLGFDEEGNLDLSVSLEAIRTLIAANPTGSFTDLELSDLGTLTSGTVLKRRRGTTAQHAAFTGQNGEATVDTDKKTLVVHNGAKLGGFPVQSEMNVNVRAFGAVGDGVTDDRAAFVAALAYVAALAVGPKVLFVPEGTYKFTSNTAITIPNGVSIIGAGRKKTIFTVTTVFGISKWWTHAGSGSVERVTFKTSQVLDYTTLTNTGTPLAITDDDVIVRDCHFENTSNDGVYWSKSTSTLRNISILNNTFKNCVRGAIIGIGGDEVTIIGNQINSPGYFGINVEADAAFYFGNVIISNNTILGSRTPLSAVGEPGVGANFDSSYAIISNNICNTGAKLAGTTGGVFIQTRTKRAAITGNVCRGETYDKCVQISNAEMFTLANNSFEVTARTSNECAVAVITSMGYASSNYYRVPASGSLALFFKLTSTSVVWVHEQMFTVLGVREALLSSVDGTSTLLGARMEKTQLGGGFEHVIELLGAANALGARVLMDGGDLRLDLAPTSARFKSRTNANASWLETSAGGKINLLLTDLPTANPGAGLLWNDAGTVKVGT
jgi:hypothetical protein